MSPSRELEAPAPTMRRCGSQKKPSNVVFVSARNCVITFENSKCLTSGRRFCICGFSFFLGGLSSLRKSFLRFLYHGATCAEPTWYYSRNDANPTRLVFRWQADHARSTFPCI